MTPLPEAEAKRWLAATRAQLSDYPMRVPGPSGDSVNVAYLKDHNGDYVILTGFAESDGHLQPIELEVTDGCVAQLDQLRVGYDTGAN